MARRIGLGKGLDALLDNNDDDFLSVPLTDILLESDNSADTQISSPGKKTASDEVSGNTSGGADIVLIPAEKLAAYPGQPRKRFDETELQELADSIKTFGIIQPIIAADAGDGTYFIIAGERRTRAAKLAGLEKIPGIIRKYTDQKRMEVSLIENIQRSDLNPIEEAVAYKNLMDFSALSQDDLAARVGKNRSTVANALRLLKLPAEMQKSIEEGKVSSGHARALLSVTDTNARETLFREIISSEISVRETEKRAGVLNENKPGKKEKPAAKASKRPPEVDAMEERFIERLGTKVVIEGNLNKGRILIDYFSMEDLERLYEIFCE